MMYMNISEFRNNLKEAFDAALSGNAVIIERGGVTYKLVADVVVVGSKPAAVTELKIVPEPFRDLGIRPLTEVIDDPYKNLVLDSAAGRVADTELEEYIDADPEVVKELKRRGQVK